MNSSISPKQGEKVRVNGHTQKNFKQPQFRALSQFNGLLVLTPPQLCLSFSPIMYE